MGILRHNMNFIISKNVFLLENMARRDLIRVGIYLFVLVCYSFEDKYEQRIELYVGRG